MRCALRRDPTCCTCPYINYERDECFTLAAGGVAIVAEVCDPVRVLAQGHTQLGGHVLEERREEVDVLDKDLRRRGPSEWCRR